MTSIIKFTPILGGIRRRPSAMEVEDAADPGEDGAMAYVLEIDEAVLLLDCGWDDGFEEATVQALRPWVPRITAVLLSHADVAHCGALAYLHGRAGLRAPVYATIPVAMMGQMTLYDAHHARHALEDFGAWSLDDVDAAFAAVVRLHYAQRVQVPGTQGIEITPYASGHTVGGTIWKIQKEIEEIVYAVDFNHKKERHLNGTVLETLKRPTVLITDALNALTAQAPLRDRNQQLLDLISGAVAAGGNVLLPVDTAGRVLELLLCLEQQWSPQRSAVPVVFLTNVAHTTAEYARSHLEWMSDAVMKMSDYQRANPFQFKYIAVRRSLADLEGLPSPKIVLASSASLDCGMAHTLFLQWASNPRNLVILTDRGYAGSLAHTLLSRERAGGMLSIVVKKRVPLVGEELALFLAEKSRREQEERDLFAQGADTEFINLDSTSANEMMDVVMLEEDARGARERIQGSVMETIRASFVGGHDWIVDRNARQILARSSLFPSAPMFPYSFKRSRFDVWGEVVDADALRAKAAAATSAASASAASAVGAAGSAVGAPGTAGAGAASAAAGGDAGGAEADAGAAAGEADADARPTKCIVETINFAINCQIRYVDFEGRSDGRSMKQILNHVAPRKVVLVHGSEAAAAHLRQHLETSLANVCQSVDAPAAGETVDITLDTNILKVRVKESLNSQLKFVPLGQYEVGFFAGALRTGGDLLQLEPLGEVVPHGAVFVGDLRLAEFREELARLGLRTELMGGVLVCNDVVSVTKEVVGNHAKVTLRGSICDEYYAVRDQLISKFALL
jgi:cleavage and polyadenylation specificity factor subunit 2